MQIKHTDTASGKEVKLSGRMTFTEKEIFDSLIDEMKGRAGSEYVLNLQELQFIDSCGLGMLLHMTEVQKEYNINIKLTGVSGQVERLLHIAKMDHFFTIERAPVVAGSC